MSYCDIGKGNNDNMFAARTSSVSAECRVCLFDKVKPEEWISCSENIDAHRFCKACFNHNVSAKLEERVVEIKCMDPDCKKLYDACTFRKFLDVGVLKTFEKIEQDWSISLANIEGLRNCPNCSFACVLDEDAKSFACSNETCGAHTCLTCHKDWNEGHDCDEDKIGAARRKIEEARSKAAISPCPCCEMKVAKSGGCNKLKCPSCKTWWCFLCSATLDKRNPYNHFSEHTCVLWGDRTGQTVNEKIKAAEQKMRKEILEADPTIREEQLAIDVGKDYFPETNPALVPDVDDLHQGEPDFGGQIHFEDGDQLEQDRPIFNYGQVQYFPAQPAHRRPRRRNRVAVADQIPVPRRRENHPRVPDIPQDRQAVVDKVFT
jgi:TRIAD3 protein (E3 ubiquitin-protein ligase RNF216)